jgi:hypothetical protein
MDARRIPFTKDDERRIASAATWGLIVSISSIATALISLAIQALALTSVDRSIPVQLQTLTSGVAGAGMIQALLTTLFNVWLLQASLAFRKVATTDEADQVYLLAGFRKLRAYFMIQVILILGVVGLGILAAMVLPTLM